VFQPRFVTAPPLAVDPATASEFASMLAAAAARNGGTVDYTAAAPKHRFLRWLAEEQGCLLHGSNNISIEVFEPRPQTDAVQRATQAVFAAADGLWPMFFAIVDRSRRHSLRNGFWRDDAGRRVYNFAVDEQTLHGGHFVAGALYVLASDGFSPCVAVDGSPTEEWLCPTPAVPLARLLVQPGDFPFLADITSFDASDAFRAADALTVAEREAVVVREDSAGLTFVLPADHRRVAVDLVAALPTLELADVTASVDGSVEGATIELRLTGAPSLLQTLRTWAGLPP
jgi:hypothetical protein